MGVLEFINERPHGGTAWVIGDFQSVRTPLELDSLAFGQKGPVVGSIVAKLRISRSEITITYSLKAGQPWVDVEVQAHWLEVGTKTTGVPMLRMAFPMALEQARGRYEIPFGSIERDEPAGQEVPALRWADVTGKAPGGGKAGARQAGCALLNDCKYGHSLDGSTLRLTLIRSTYDPDTLPEIGDHAVRMALVPHGKPLAAADLVRLGAAFNHPLAVVATDAHAGDLPAAAEGACVTPDGVVLSSVRKAQDDDALIFHLFETAGRDATARVTLDARVFGTVTAAEEVDFLERPVEKPTAKRLPRGFTVDLPARGITAVKVTMG
jgi:alpha-mannosidase